MKTFEVKSLHELLQHLVRRHSVTLSGTAGQAHMEVAVLLPVGRAIMSPNTMRTLRASAPYDHAIESPLELRGLRESDKLAGVRIAYDDAIPDGMVELHLKF